MKIRSKHNDLLNYFIHDPRDLSPAYVRSCEKFLKEISDKQQASSVQLDLLDGESYQIRKIKSSKRQAPSATKQTQLKGIKKYD